MRAALSPRWPRAGAGKTPRFPETISGRAGGLLLVPWLAPGQLGLSPLPAWAPHAGSFHGLTFVFCPAPCSRTFHRQRSMCTHTTEGAPAIPEIFAFLLCTGPSVPHHGRKIAIAVLAPCQHPHSCLWSPQLCHSPRLPCTLLPPSLTHTCTQAHTHTLTLTPARVIISKLS